MNAVVKPGTCSCACFECKRDRHCLRSDPEHGCDWNHNGRGRPAAPAASAPLTDVEAREDLLHALDAETMDDPGDAVDLDERTDLAEGHPW